MIIPELPLYLVSNDLRTGAKFQGFLMGEDVGETEEYYCYVGENKMYMMSHITVSGSVRISKYFFGTQFAESDWNGRATKTYQYPYLNGA